MGAQPLTELPSRSLCAACLYWMHCTLVRTPVYTQLCAPVHQASQVYPPPWAYLHPRHWPKLTVLCTRSGFADILSAPHHLSWHLRNRFPERHTWRNYQSRTRVSLPPAVCEVVKSLLTTLIPISQPECASVLLHRKKHTLQTNAWACGGESCRKKGILPITPPSLLSHSLLGILTGARWASGREGQQRIHPLCVPGEITLSSATLKLGLSFWNLWGWHKASSGDGREWSWVYKEPQGANSLSVLFTWALWDLRVLNSTLHASPHFKDQHTLHLTHVRAACFWTI